MKFLKTDLLKWIGMALLMLVISTSCSKDEDEDDNPVKSSSSFCYSFEGNTSSYDTITGGTEITTLTEDYFYEIDLGFSFTFCDSTFETLYISYLYGPTFTYVSGNGITDMMGYELIPFGAAKLEQRSGTVSSGTSGNVSKLISKTTGSAGNRVTTIEWRDFDYSESLLTDNSNVNFQIKLYENGNKVVYHYGAHNVTSDFTTLPFARFSIGLYGSNASDAIYLSGDASNPTVNTSLGSNVISTWPAEGTVYTFN